MTPILIDASLWVDFTRAKSPAALKRFLVPFILDPAAHLAEPVVFELLRFATDQESKLLEREFANFPSLPTPPDLWRHAADLGRACRKAGFVAGAVDLLIAAVAIHHHAEVITFDEKFTRISEHSALRTRLLTRPL